MSPSELNQDTVEGNGTIFIPKGYKPQDISGTQRLEPRRGKYITLYLKWHNDGKGNA